MVCFINFVILLIYEGTRSTIQLNTTKNKAPSKQVKKEKAPKNKVKYCNPHTQLVTKYGLPGPCNYDHLILDCSDPYKDFIHDPKVLYSCGITNSSRIPKLTDLLKRGDVKGWDNCTKNKGILISNTTLPVQQSSPGEIPNLVHYVSLGCNRGFAFVNFLSVLSVHKFIKPYRIYFHGDCLPKGHWWNETLRQIPNIYFRKRGRTKFIQGRHPRWVEHETDIIRIQILLGKVIFRFQLLCQNFQMCENCACLYHFNKLLYC